MKSFPFDKRQTNIAKGIATLLLLWHHLFYYHPNVFKRFTSLYLIKSVPVESLIARSVKVCVATFLLLSGYGLLKSWESKASKGGLGPYKLKIKDQLLFVKNHLLKLMMNFWFIYIIFVPMGLFFGFSFIEKYQGSIVKGLIDFFGLACLFNTPTVNDTWWFMSAIIILYLLFPLMMRITRWSPELMLVISFLLMRSHFMTSIPYIGKLFIWFPPFVLGMYLAYINGLERLRSKTNNLAIRLILCFSLLLLTGIMRAAINQKLYYDAECALAVVLFSYFAVSGVPVLSTVLEQLGKQSGSIFMFHTFIYHDYFKTFIYGFKYAPIIFIVLTVICWAVSVGLEYLKKLIRYDKLTAWLTR